MQADSPGSADCKPQQQHWVPRVYLKHFATAESVSTGDPKVFVWDKENDRQRPGVARVGAICKQRFLYSPKLLDGSRDWSMEEELGIAEAKAGEVWSELIDGESPLQNPELREFVAHFIALLHVRNVSIFDLTHKATRLVRELYGMPDQSKRASQVDPACAENFATGTFVSLIRSSVSRVTPELLKKRWVILQFSERVLATCDRPTLFHMQARLVKGSLGGRASVFFPVSASRVLYMDNLTDQKSNVVVDGEPEWASLVNRLTEQSALRVVISARPKADLPTLSHTP